MISKNITELAEIHSDEYYFAHHALGHSSIARFMREGFSCIPHLFENVESDSLRFGSLLDCLLTDSYQSFKSRYFIQKYAYNKDTDYYKVADALFKKFSEVEWDNISSEDKLSVRNETGAWSKLVKEETIIAKIDKECKAIFNDLKESKGKTLISYQEYQDAKNCMDAVYSNPMTAFFFIPWNELTKEQKEEARKCIAEYRNLPDDAPDPYKRYFQLQFYTTMYGVDVKIKPDIFMVNEEAKKVIPIDLKSSSFPEWDFAKRFIDLNYMSQANMYSRVLRHIFDNSEYKDYIITDFYFCVVCPTTLTPLAFKFKENFTEGDFTIGKYKFKDPFPYAVKLSNYLKNLNTYRVPTYIKEKGVNDLSSLIENL